MNQVISSLVDKAALPRMARARQVFADDAIEDVEAAVRTEFRGAGVANRITTGASIAVAVGSRGLADLPILVRTIVDELKRCGAEPFVVPAMGSHGGATAEGQENLLASLGVTAETVGCPIRSSMETVEIDTLDNGLPVLMDALAMEADGIAIINRVKPHTSFSGTYESGLVKMISIGLGKQRGAQSCHALGFGEMATNIVDMARIKLAKTKLLFGLASVENSYDRICRLAVVPAEQILEQEPDLLREAKARMPRILFNPLDILVVDRMGKEYSGAGMDPNITGRASTPYVESRLQTTRLVVLDLSDKTAGNATGVGLADVCTKRLFERIDFQATYANHITSTTIAGARIPMMMETDKLAIQAAATTCNSPTMDRLRVVRIPNTLHLETILISEALLDEAADNPSIVVESDPQDWSFDAAGTQAAFDYGVPRAA